MIDGRFSAQGFDACGRNSPTSKDLTRALQSAIAEELLADVRALGLKVAEKLNGLGHAIREVDCEIDHNGLVSVTFIDRSDGESPEQHRLRFNLDLVVSVGFPDYEESESR